MVSPGLSTFAATVVPALDSTTGGPPPSDEVMCNCGRAMNRLVVLLESVVSGCGITRATGRLPVTLFGMYGGREMVFVPIGMAGTEETALWMLTVDPAVWLEMGTLMSLVAPPMPAIALEVVRMRAGVALSGMGLAEEAMGTGFSVTFTCWPKGTDGITVILDWLRPMRRGWPVPDIPMGGGLCWARD
jgi:hypothetical protein